MTPHPVIPSCHAPAGAPRRDEHPCSEQRSEGSPGERCSSNAIHRRIIAGLNRAGFTDLRPPHMAALLHPGPDGYRPSELAERAGISKQAMNQLLQSLERLGYIERGAADSDDGRARVVHFTERGRAAWESILDVLADIETEWRSTLGDEKFARLKELLGEVWVSDLVR